MKRIGTRSLTLALGAMASLAAAVPVLAQTSTSNDVAGPAYGAGLMICGLLMFVVIIAFYVWVAVWIFRDANKRGISGVLWALIWIVLNMLGLIIYLVVRPRDFVSEGAGTTYTTGENPLPPEPGASD